MTARERNLLYAFCAIIVLIVTFFVLSWRGDEMKAATIAKLDAEQELAHAQMRIDSTKAGIEQRREWLESRQISELTEADASSQLLKRAEQAALSAGVKVEGSKFLDLIRGVDFDQARMTGKIEGTEEAVYSALVSFHDPDQLQVIRELRIQPDPKVKGKIIATVEFRFYYRPLSAESDQESVEVSLGV